MRHRVRSAALILRSPPHPTEILLVKHCRPQSGTVLWLPPGGGLEAQDASIFACAQRETWEESGLTVQPSHIAYIHEFIDAPNQIRHVAFYFAVEAVAGQVSLNHLPDDASNSLTVVETVWVSKSAIAALPVYPDYLKTAAFWQDAAQGFPTTKYLEVMTEF